jgi:hypothetical protein
MLVLLSVVSAQLCTHSFVRSLLVRFSLIQFMAVMCVFVLLNPIGLDFLLFRCVAVIGMFVLLNPINSTWWSAMVFVVCIMLLRALVAPLLMFYRNIMK